MATNLGIDFTKQDALATSTEQNPRRQNIQDWHNNLKENCNILSTSTDLFDENSAFELIKNYIKTYGRWLYSDISDYLFNCDEQTVSTFLTNLDKLQDFAHTLSRESPYFNLVTTIDKLWDHSNLAQKQNVNLHDNDDAFKARFNKNLIPFEAKFTHEMNIQFISLIAIFTALSFIVFGGISYLDNIFSGAKHVPILELIIIGCIWSICVSNLVFVFMFFISKLTNISIKSSDKIDARLSEKYPFMIWCNYFLLMILIFSCWLYFINHAKLGGWFISLCQKYPDTSLLIGTVSISIVFIAIAILLIKPWIRK